MATVVSVPAIAYQASILSGSGVAQSSSTTVTFDVRTCWEAWIDVRGALSAVSASPIINFYSSNDGGVNYDTQPLFAFSLPATPGPNRGTIRIPPGQYAVQLLNSGPNTATFFVDTFALVTSVPTI